MGAIAGMARSNSAIAGMARSYGSIAAKPTPTIHFFSLYLPAGARKWRNW